MKTEKQVRTWWIVNHGGMNQDLTVQTTKRELGPIWFQEQLEVIAHEDHLAIVAELESRVTKMRSVFEKILNEGVDTSTDGGMNFVKEALAEDEKN